MSDERSAEKLLKNSKKSHQTASSPAKKKVKKASSVEGSRSKNHNSHQNAQPLADGKQKKKYVKIEPDTDEGEGAGSSHNRNLPLTRVRSIMDTSPNASGLKISGDATFAMAKAAEAFVEMLARGAHQQVADGHARVNYNELALFVHHSEELNFIQDILPRKHKFSEVSKLLRKIKR